MMAEFISFNPDIEVQGGAIFSVINAMEPYKRRGYEILEKNGIENPVPTGWYPLQNWLDAFKDIYELIGPVTLKLIGLQQAQQVPVAPHVNTLEKVFNNLDKVYHMSHRIDGNVMYNPASDKILEGIGNYFYEKTGETSAKLVCNTPYPCVFDMGGCEGMMQRFKTAEDSFIKVVHINDSDCRRNGGESCTYDISWKKINL